jgi:plasmid stabilization system protein ParE
MRLRYSRRALRHIIQISVYLEERSPAAARQTGQRIRDVIRMLLDHPESGRTGAQSGTRELLVTGTPYVVVYNVRGPDRSELRIAGIYHAAQLRPGQTRPSRN